MTGREACLLSGAVLSLIVSCVLWSPHKQVWMDEIFTWREVSDPSLWHLYLAIQHGADGGQPLFYTTAWLWARVFGFGVVALRMYSCVAVSASLVITWLTFRRFYGVWATAFGVLAFWGTSGVLLDQNVEARFYGLYLLAVAITVNIYARLVACSVPTRALLLAAFLSQAALVMTHVLGIIYGGLALSALILFDAANGRLRTKVYAVYSAGWLVLAVWIPAIRASMAAGKPHSWIFMPTLTALRTAYLFADSFVWLKFFKRHSFELGFQAVSRIAELMIYLPLAVALLLSLRAISRFGWPVIARHRGPILLLAYALLSAPVVLFVLSHLIAPVFVPRYLLPSGIGLAIVLTASADYVGAQIRSRGRQVPRLLQGALVAFLMVSPVLTVVAVGQPNTYRGYLDVRRLEQMIPPHSTVVAAWQEDFTKLMRLSDGRGTHYYFPLDWSTALQGPRSFVLDYHLMAAYRDSGYYAQNIVDNRAFLCSHSDFLVLSAPNAATLDGIVPDRPELMGSNWFDVNIRTAPQFQWKVIDAFDSTEVTRKLIAVHRTGTLPFCQQR
jgi:hypothetical protein